MGGGSTGGSSSGPVTPPAPPKRERVKMYNGCSKPMRLHFERPGANLDTSITNGSNEEFPAGDGDEIRLMDETGRNVVDKMTIAPTMKRVVVASSCTKLEPEQ